MTLRRARTAFRFGLALSTPLLFRGSIGAQSMDPAKTLRPDAARIRSAGRVIGIFDSGTGEPLEGVVICDVLSGVCAKTTVTGTASLSFVTYRDSVAAISLKKLGYEPLLRILSLGDTSSITEVMSPTAVNLPATVTTANYRLDTDPATWDGFERRCHVKSVQCIKEDELAAHPSKQLRDFLRSLSGMATCNDRGPTSLLKVPPRAQQPVTPCIIQMRSTSANDPSKCTPIYYVDGFVTPLPLEEIESHWKATTIRGIEVFLSGEPRPLRYESVGPFQKRCGVVALWTK